MWKTLPCCDVIMHSYFSWFTFITFTEELISGIFFHLVLWLCLCMPCWRTIACRCHKMVTLCWHLRGFCPHLSHCDAHKLNEVCIILSALFNIVVWSAKIDSHRKYVNHGEIQICLHQSDDKLFKKTIKIGTELRGACNQHSLTRISAWISVDIHYIMWDVITLPSVNFHWMV